MLPHFCVFGSLQNRTILVKNKLGVPDALKKSRKGMRRKNRKIFILTMKQVVTTRVFN